MSHLPLAQEGLRHLLAQLTDSVGGLVGGLGGGLVGGWWVGGWGGLGATAAYMMAGVLCWLGAVLLHLAVLSSRRPQR